MNIIDVAGSHYDYKFSDVGAHRNAKAHLQNGGISTSYRSFRSIVGRTGDKYYAEMLVGQNVADALIGIFEAATALNLTGSTVTYPGGHPSQSGISFGLYMVGGSFSIWTQDTYDTYGSSYTTGDVIGCAVDFPNEKIWWSINGTYPGGGDPAAGTGEAFAILDSATTYHFAGSDRVGAVEYNAGSGYIMTMRLAAAQFDYTPPTGFKAWLPAGSVTLTVRDEAGATINSTAFDWAFFEQVTADALAVPVAAGTTSTNGSGVLAISIPYTSLDNGDTGALLLSTTAGTAGVQCRSWFMPVTVTV